MSEAYGLTCHPCGLVPESKLSHKPQDRHSLVPKPLTSWWKNHRLTGSKTYTAHRQRLHWTIEIVF